MADHVPGADQKPARDAAGDRDPGADQEDLVESADESGVRRRYGLIAKLRRDRRQRALDRSGGDRVGERLLSKRPLEVPCSSLNVGRP